MEILAIKRSDIAKLVLYGGREKKTAKQVLDSLTEKPDYIINAVQYDRPSGITIADTIVEGEFINGGNYTPKGIAFNNIDDLTECTSNQARDLGFKYFMGGGPNLMWEGQLNMDGKNYAGDTKFTNWDLNYGNAHRIAVGYTDSELMFYFPTNKTTIKAVGNYMVKYGCKAAINLDGGGSTKVCKVENGELVDLNIPEENRANSTWLLVYLNKKIPVVSIDPASDKGEIGAVGLHGTRECDINFSISNMVKQYLEGFGIEAHLTRGKDDVRDVTVRTSAANKMKSDIYVSIHCKPSYVDDESLGIETYVYSKGGNGDKLGTVIHNRVVEVTHDQDNGVSVNKQFKELSKTSMPASVIEIGNILDEETEVKLRTPEYRKHIALAIAIGICEYFNFELCNPPIEVVDEYTLSELVFEEKEPEDPAAVIIKEVWEKYGLNAEEWLSVKDEPVTVSQLFNIISKIL